MRGKPRMWSGCVCFRHLWVFVCAFEMYYHWLGLLFSMAINLLVYFSILSNRGVFGQRRLTNLKFQAKLNTHKMTTCREPHTLCPYAQHSTIADWFILWDDTVTVAPFIFHISFHLFFFQFILTVGAGYLWSC